MVIYGEIGDRARLRAYAEALRASGLYPRLLGYYLIAPNPVAVFEGEIPAEASTLIVRFPCLAAARAFWFSRAYQEKVRPARRNPSAGRFTVTVFEEVPVPDYVQDRLEGGVFRRDGAGLPVTEEPQVAPGAETPPPRKPEGR